MQAEALKFFIERHRRSEKCTGLIWWNIKDCWPQTTDSIVDYYGAKKFAWHYVAVCQQPLLGMIFDANAWHRKVVFADIKALKVGIAAHIDSRDFVLISIYPLKAGVVAHIESSKLIMAAVEEYKVCIESNIQR